MECRYTLIENSLNNLFGELIMTNFKLWFKPNQAKDSLKFEVSYGHIAKVVSTETSVSVFCKDERFLRFKIENQSNHQNVLRTI